jgi:hypothetical protein
MYSYSDRINPQDRWAIAAYIKALQLAGHYPAGQLSPDQRAQVAAAVEKRKHMEAARGHTEAEAALPTATAPAAGQTTHPAPPQAQHQEPQPTQTQPTTSQQKSH